MRNARAGSQEDMSMEEILASIRQIISEDKNVHPSALKATKSVPPPATHEADILELRNPISGPKNFQPKSPVSPYGRSNTRSSQFSQRPEQASEERQNSRKEISEPLHANTFGKVEGMEGFVRVTLEKSVEDFFREWAPRHLPQFVEKALEDIMPQIVEKILREHMETLFRTYYAKR